MRQISRKQLFYDERIDGFCIFCGSNNPSTRDHNPSRVFLDKPYPENLPVVSSCLDCNNGFSADEEYVACLFECIVCNTVNPEKMMRAKISKILTKNEKLREMLNETKVTQEKISSFTINSERVKRVILKLARGHIKFENADLQYSTPNSISFLHVPNMTADEQKDFFHIQELQISPEIGSRATHQIAMIGGMPITKWEVVQKGNYEYSVFNTRSELVVKILIRDEFAFEVVW